MDRKTIREIVGLTFANNKSNKDYWYRLAVAFYHGASVLYENKDKYDFSRVFLLNASLSLELLFKAINVASGQEAPRTHKLLNLARAADVAYTENQQITLTMMTEIITWMGRYPAPLKEEDWNNYHDIILETMIVRETDGNISITRKNPRTFPTIENYEALWSTAIRRWETVVKTQAGCQNFIK